MSERTVEVEQLVSTEETADRRPQFGGRFLTNEDDVFVQNAWDNVEWNEEQEKEAAEAVAKNSAQKMPEDDRGKFQKHADRYWDSFYDVHNNRFFKNRHWLFTEFPELAEQTTKNIFELGCGVGNTILPIISYNPDKQLRVFGCDFSQRAIDILREHEKFEAERCQVFVMDATLKDWSSKVPFEQNSMDIILLIFVLSAIEPGKMQDVARNCYRYLRPGGMLLLRDYGRYDLAQLRFKNGKCLEDNCYVRGDGTMVYFFTVEELKQLFGQAGFREVSTNVDRRLQVNRGRMLKMYRVWIQTKFTKPLDS